MQAVRNVWRGHALCTGEFHLTSLKIGSVLYNLDCAILIQAYVHAHHPGGEFLPPYVYMFQGPTSIQ